MYLLFDIGGTKMRLAASPDLTKLGEIKIVSTPLTFAEALTLFKTTARELLGTESPVAIVGGVAGTFDAAKKVLTRAPHLNEWAGQPLTTLLATEFACPVFLENDTALVGLGEATFGAGRGTRLVVYLTVSTGVGGVRLVDGKIDEHHYGFEPGHQIIDYQNPSRRLEDYVGGAAVAGARGQAPNLIDEPAFWQDLAGVLAVGLCNSILHWSPELVVLGGSMIGRQPGIAVADVISALERLTPVFPSWPAIKGASLEDKGGLWGALALARQKLSV